MAEKTVEDYSIALFEKLEQLTIATTFIQNRGNIAGELTALQTEVSSLKNGLDLARSELEAIRDGNEAIKGYLKILDISNAEINHMELNLPSNLLHDCANMQLNGSENSGEIVKAETPNCPNLGDELSDDVFQEDNKKNMVKNCKKILFNEPELFPKIKLLGREEFELIPKYMIGRQTLDALNQFLNTINEILKAKYTLMALGKNGARKKGEFDLYMAYKSQEISDGKEQGKVCFFTAEDYYRQTKTKLDKTKLNLLTVLRHCKRLREVRTSKAIRYAVVVPL